MYTPTRKKFLKLNHGRVNKEWAYQCVKKSFYLPPKSPDINWCVSENLFTANTLSVAFFATVFGSKHVYYIQYEKVKEEKIKTSIVVGSTSLIKIRKMAKKKPSAQ